MSDPRLSEFLNKQPVQLSPPIIAALQRVRSGMSGDDEAELLGLHIMVLECDKAALRRRIDRAVISLGGAAVCASCPHD